MATESLNNSMGTNVGIDNNVSIDFKVTGIKDLENCKTTLEALTKLQELANKHKISLETKISNNQKALTSYAIGSSGYKIVNKNLNANIQTLKDTETFLSKVSNALVNSSKAVTSETKKQVSHSKQKKDNAKEEEHIAKTKKNHSKEEVELEKEKKSQIKEEIKYAKEKVQNARLETEAAKLQLEITRKQSIEKQKQTIEAKLQTAEAQKQLSASQFDKNLKSSSYSLALALKNAGVKGNVETLAGKIEPYIIQPHDIGETLDWAYENKMINYGTYLQLGSKNGTIDVAKEFYNNFTSSIDGIGSIFSGMQRAFWSMGRKIRTLAASFYAVRNALDILDGAMANIDYLEAQAYRLQRYDTTGASKTTLLNGLYSKAQETRTSLENTATLSQRILATGVTKGSSAEALRLAGIIQMASFLGGSTETEAKMAQMQLSQGLASNSLQGDELRSVRENAIGLTEMLSKGLMKAYKEGLLTDSDFAEVDIGKLKELGKQTKLTADVVTTAFSVMEDEITEGFKNSPRLFGQNITIIKNQWDKLMYDMGQDGKGVARIAQAFQRLTDYLTSDKGEKAIKNLANIVDKVIEAIVNIISTIGGFLSKFNGNALGTIAKYLIYFSAFKAGSGLLLGSHYYTGNGQERYVPGLVGYGGLLRSILRVSSGGKIGSMTGMHPFGIAGDIIEKIYKASTAFKILTTGAKGLNTAILPIITKLGLLGVGIAGVLAIIAAYKHFDKKAEEENFNKFKSGLDTFSDLKYLTESDKTRLSEFAKNWYDENTNTKGYGSKNLWSKSQLEKFESQYASLAIELNNNSYQKQILEKAEAIAENTAGQLDITEEYLRNIADMRTRTFRGELLTGGQRTENHIVLSVSYTGDVADFDDKVLNAWNNKVIPQIEKTAPIS